MAIPPSTLVAILIIGTATASLKPITYAHLILVERATIRLQIKDKHNLLQFNRNVVSNNRQTEPSG